LTENIGGRPGSRDKDSPGNVFHCRIENGRSCFIPSNLNWVRRFWCGNAFCTKHVLRVTPDALEHHWYPAAVRIKRGALLNGPAGSVIPADRRGADRGKENHEGLVEEKGTGMQGHSKRRTQRASVRMTSV
jgi:hypothetical protein